MIQCFGVLERLWTLDTMNSHYMEKSCVKKRKYHTGWNENEQRQNINFWVNLPFKNKCVLAIHGITTPFVSACAIGGLQLLSYLISSHTDWLIFNLISSDIKKWPEGTPCPGKMTLGTPQRSWSPDHFLLIQFPPTKLILLAGSLATKHYCQHPVSQSPVGFGWRWFTPTTRHQGHKSTAVKSPLSTAITESSLITDTDQWDDGGRAASKKLLFTD